jgi:hypothetical protein
VEKISIMCAILMSLGGPLAAGEPGGKSVVRVDCARPGPAELVRKFDMCQTGWSPPKAWASLATGRVGPLGCRQVRIVGALLHSRFGGQPLGEPILKLLSSQGAAPYVCLDPNVLDGQGSMEKPPSDMARWRQLLRRAAAQAREHGGVWFEVWNEPNTLTFWRGTRDELHELYRVMVQEVRAVHPKAKFAGPGFTSGGLGKWLAPFLDFVEKNELPLDAVAFHDFGRDYTLGERWILPHVKECLAELDRRPYFKDRRVEIHVGECSFFGDPKDGEAADRAEAAARLPRLFRLLLAEPRLTLVQWAQLFDTGHKGLWGNLGVIDAETGKAKPLYNVFLMYAMMPTKSASYETTGPVGCLAGQDERTVAVMLSNETEQDSPTAIELRNLPFKAGEPVHAYVFAVDKSHSSFWDKPGDGRLELIRRGTLTPQPAEGEPGAKLSLTETIPGPGVRLLLLSAVPRRFDARVIALVADPSSP